MKSFVFCVKFHSFKGPIDTMSALVQVMDWHLTDDKSLPEPTMTQFIDANMQH